MDLPNQLLIEVGRVVPSKPEYISRLLAAMTSRDAAMFVDLVAFHRVAPQAHLNLSKGSVESQIATAAVQRVAEDSAYSERFLARHQERLADLETNSGISFTALKGVALARYYDTSIGARQIGDADILVSPPDAWRMFEYLALEGYDFRRIRFGSYRAYLSDGRHPRYYGVCPVVKRFPEGRFHVDVHVGAFPACGHGLVAVDEADSLEDSDGIRFPTTEKSLVICMAHAIRQGFCRLRDINDLYLLARSLNGEQAAGALAEVRRGYLLPLLRSMLRIVGCVYQTDLPFARAADAQGPMRWWDRELLFGYRRNADNYADGVRILWSRSWQLRYLAALETELFGPVAGSLRAAAGAALLFKTGRPYRLWQRDRNLDVDERVVVRPVATLRQPIDGPAVRGKLEAAGCLVKRSTRLEVWQIGMPTGQELVVSGRLVCVQTDYSGARPASEAIAGSIRDLARFAGVGYSHLA